MINQYTLFFGSFSGVAGGLGCAIFNKAFQIHSINAMYKSFSVTDIGKAIEAARTLGFKGFAISMPHKKEAVKYADYISEDVKQIGATNTMVNNFGRLIAHNTDFLAAKEVLSRLPAKDRLVILGNGGYAAAVTYAAKILGLEYESITRKNWQDLDKVEHSIVYNCTPIPNIHVDKSNAYIDSLISTTTGRLLALAQAKYQYKLYTGLDLPKEALLEK